MCKNIFKFFLIISAQWALLGCVVQQVPQPNDPFFAPSYPVPPEPLQASKGAIYNVASVNFLLEDQKARRVGDILLVQLSESTKASKNADTNLKKDETISIANPTILGTSPSALNGNLSFETNIAPARQFQGASDSKQSNNLDGDITVTVVQVYPNGYMLVRGEKWITLNQGREYIRLTGIVRPDDITAQNTVTSNRIGNAQIEYSGTGALAASNSQGWLGRFFSGSIWPF
jgi:flagellar L-ring protein precursor FlgH